MRLHNINVLFQDAKYLASVALLIVSSTAWAMSPGVAGAAAQVTSKLLYELEDNMPVTSLAWSADGRFIAAASTQDRRIHIWDQAGRRIVHEFTSTAAPSSFHELAWSPDGKWLVACDGFKGGVLVFDTNMWGAPRKLSNSPDACSQMSFSDDSSQLAILGGAATIYSTNTWQVLRKLDSSAAIGWTRGKLINAVSYISHTHTLLLGGAELVSREGASTSDKEFVGYVWFLGPDEPIPTVERQVYLREESSQTGIVVGLAVSPDGSEIATGANTGSGPPARMVSDSVHIFRTSDGSMLASPLDGKGYSNQAGLQYTRDGRYLIVGHGGVRVEHVVHILDTKTYAVVGSVPAHGTIYDVAIEPSGNAFAVGAGGTISVWTLPPNR